MFTGEELYEGAMAKKSTAAGLDGWAWNEIKALSLSWFVGLALVLRQVEAAGHWPQGLLDAYIAMISKAEGDSTPLGQRPLCVLPVVFRLWASVRLSHLKEWFSSWVPDSVFSAGKVSLRLMLGMPLPLTLRRFLATLVILTFISSLLTLSSLLTQQKGTFLTVPLVGLVSHPGFEGFISPFIKMFDFDLNLLLV